MGERTDFFFFIQWKPTESFPLIDREVWYLLVSTQKKKSFLHPLTFKLLTFDLENSHFGVWGPRRLLRGFQSSIAFAICVLESKDFRPRRTRGTDFACPGGRAS